MVCELALSFDVKCDLGEAPKETAWEVESCLRDSGKSGTCCPFGTSVCVRPPKELGFVSVFFFFSNSGKGIFCLVADFTVPSQLHIASGDLPVEQNVT